VGVVGAGGLWRAVVIDILGITLLLSVVVDILLKVAKPSSNIQ
jgi:hypothetical protein